MRRKYRDVGFFQKAKHAVRVGTVFNFLGFALESADFCGGKNHHSVSVGEPVQGAAQSAQTGGRHRGAPFHGVDGQEVRLQGLDAFQQLVPHDFDVWAHGLDNFQHY